MCPSKRHAPRSRAGIEAWDVVVRCQSQLRIVPMGGVIGIELGTAMQVGQALGYDMAGLARLLPWAEAGMIAGLNKGASNEQH